MVLRQGAFSSTPEIELVRLGIFALAAALALSTGGWSSGVRAAELVTAIARPARPCLTARNPAYINVDFLIRNAGETDAYVTEIRASVFDKSGRTIEQRLVWQSALDLIGLGPASKIPARSERLAYNPVLFGTATEGRRVKYEFKLSSQLAPVVIEIVPDRCVTRAALVLPLAGRVLVLDGSDLMSHHRRFDFLSDWARSQGLTDNPQRFALDLMLVNEAGETSSGQGSRNEDFFGWGKPVRAPGEGIVVAEQDGQPDNAQVGEEDRWTNRTWVGAAGNYVMIDHGTGEFSQLSHLQNQSITVKVGQRVERGEIIGRVGNSGASLMPHVHYQLQDRADHQGALGLPAYIGQIKLVDGSSRSEEKVVLDSGDIVVAR